MLKILNFYVVLKKQTKDKDIFLILLIHDNLILSDVMQSVFCTVLLKDSFLQ